MLKLLKHLNAERMPVRDALVISAIDQQPGCSVREIAAETTLVKPVVSRIIGDLAHRKLVKVDRAPIDTRLVVCQLTPAGRDWVASAKAAADA